MAGTTSNFIAKSSALAAESQAWVAGNIVGILVAAAIGVAIALAMLAIRSLGCRLIARLQGDPHWPAIFAKALAKTKIYFIVLTSAQLVADHANTPPALRSAIHVGFVIAACLQAAIWARELILGYVAHRTGDEEQSTLASAIGIIRLLVTVTLFAIAIILILDNLGVNVTGLIAGLGIGGIAIGLAAQGIFSDLFAALSIIFDKPFRRGETITFGSPPTTGTVERIGLKSTRIRAVSGEEVIMSNANLLNALVQNWTRLERRRALIVLQLVYRTPVETLERLPGELRAIVEREALARFDRAHVIAFNPSSIDIELVFFVEASDLPDFLEVRQAVMLGILRRFAELGVEFAYPTQTTFTAAPDGRLIMPYAVKTARD
ncbi:MAG TPA: mechanosensitive ion channel domain-containing protein [Allosphingosinicella sp.]|nr:mechanosensitive ion channel domain-containing protein [Allosphingosinicella sp.]